MFCLAADLRKSLHRFAADRGLDVTEAAELALRDWLISFGYLEPEHELDEDTETAGEA